MPADQKQKDDPQETAEYLLKMRGQDEAYAVAVKGAIDAQDAGDNYRLSIWRDVKRLLKQGSSSSEEPATDTGQ
jgi:hypothetical protein